MAEILSLLTNRRFVLAAGTAAVIVVLSAILASNSLQIAVVGIIASLMLGLLVVRNDGRPTLDSDLIQQTFQIAGDREAFQHQQTLTTSLARCVQHGDPLFRSLAFKRFGMLAEAADEIAGGTLIYEDTETWRLVYEQLLRSPGLHLYRSAALVTSSAYWQDEPGRQSMRLNFEMQQSGRLTIERTVIIADEFWAANEHLPSEPLRHWIEEQRHHGILLRLVRLSALRNELDLQADIGIYGSRAVGNQVLSPHSKTLRFVLSFDFNRVREAEERWNRLTVYATPYRDLLERPEFDL
jgi:hypothetical protein